MPDNKRNDPAENLKGYDPKQRAEILETESVNVEGRDMIEELTPDRGQSIVEPMPPEDQLHDDNGKGASPGLATPADAEGETPEGGPDAEAADEKLEKGDVDVGMKNAGGISVLGKDENSDEPNDGGFA